MVAWVLRTYRFSTWPCTINKGGSSKWSHNLLSPNFLKLGIFLTKVILTTNLGHNPIFCEPWLLNAESIDGNIIGTQFVREFTVDSLSNNHSKSWNDELLRQAFSEDRT